jgi:hypothetical protein
MDYISRKSLSTYLFNGYDIFMNDTWQKYAGDSSKLHLNFATDQRESEVNLHKRLLRPKVWAL